jgi:hypothetical protein
MKPPRAFKRHKYEVAQTFNGLKATVEIESHHSADDAWAIFVAGIFGRLFSPVSITKVDE